MLSLLGVIAIDLAIAVAMAFILTKTVSKVPNKICRFVFLFVLGMPFLFILNYLDVRLLELPKIGWTGVVIVALLCASFGTFWLPQSRHRNAR
jgi:hypothetical protein